MGTELLLCELHAHTTWSDGVLSIAELVDLYGTAGFDVLCVTDHTARLDDPLHRSVDAWVDGHGLVRRLKLDYDAKVDPTSKQGAHTVLTMTLSDFGIAVSAPPPPAADVVDSSEVGK